MAFFDKLSNVLGGSLMDLLVYALILFVFIIGLIKCVQPVLRNREQLRRAIRNVRAGEDARRSWQEDDFLGKGVLKAHWSDYLNNLFFADGVYHNASNVEDYINEETVILGPGRGSFAEAIPGLLVSLGFLGTLIGLARGLSGFSVKDSGAVMESISTLIPGMRYAFVTSIFGVIGSLLFTFITRMTHGSTERALRAFYGAMNRHAGVLSVDPMTQVAIYQQEQTMLIKKLSEDLAGKLTDNVAEAVARAVEPLGKSMDSFVAVNTREQMRFLDAVVNSFVDRMNEALSGKLSRFSAVLDNSAKAQEEALRTVFTSLKDTQRLMDNLHEIVNLSGSMVRENAKYIEGVAQNQKLASEGYARLASGIEKMELISSRQTDYLKSVNAMQADVSRSIERLGSEMKGYVKRMGEQSGEATSALMRAAGELRATGESLKGIRGEATAAFSQDMRNYLKEFNLWLNELASALNDSLARLPEEITGSVNHLLDEIDLLGDAIASARTGVSAQAEPRARR